MRNSKPICAIGLITALATWLGVRVRFGSQVITRSPSCGSKNLKEERTSKMFNANRDGLDRHLANARSKVVVDRTPAICGLIGFCSNFLDVMETSCLQRTRGALR